MEASSGNRGVSIGVTEGGGAFLTLRLSSFFGVLAYAAAASSQPSGSGGAGAYPAYCSVPSAMRERNIPPLEAATLSAHPDLRLLQAHVLIRHGARTPDHPSVCWRGYDETWDCEITTLMAPHDLLDSGVRQGLGGMVEESKGGWGEPEGQFLFEKVYDALRPPLSNTLGGTCNVGQLIKKGYEQELANGMHLRRAYIEGEEYMRLFQNASYAAGRPYPGSTRFRGDDNPRVMLSGQTLVRALFDVVDDTVVPFHTAERGMDPIYTNKKICPRLLELEKRADDSREFKARNASLEAESLSKVLDSTRSDWVHILDCLMTQKCNDRPLHPQFDDLTSDDDDSVFSRIVRHHTWQRTHHYRYNHAAYSKLAMGPLWAEIVSTLQLTRDRTVTTLEDMAAGDVPLLLLYSGHDSTLMPFLSTLGDNVWDGVWTPYGSMLVIESYNVGEADYKFPSGKAFRIVFNGKLLTPKICDAELCDLNILLRLVRPFATWHRQCDRDEAPETFTTDDDVVVEVYEDGTGGLSTAALIAIIVVCSLLASIATLVALTRTRFGRSLLSSTNMGYESLKDRSSTGPTGATHA